MFRLKCFLNTLIISFVAVCQLHGMNYGVMFHAHKQSPEQRTTLILNNGNPVRIGDLFTLDFVAELRREELTQYGDFLELKGNDGTSVRIMIPSSSLNPVLVINDRLFSGKEIPFNGATDITLRLDRDKSTVSLMSGNKTAVTAHCDLGSMTEAVVTFGQQVHRDVAPINVCDIRITNNGRTDYFWKLKTHIGDSAPDSVGGASATGIHSVWIADAHSIMRRVYSLSTSDETMQTAFDPAGLRLFVATDSTMTTVSLADSTSVTVAVADGERALRSSGSMFYIPEGKLMSFNAGNNTLSWYDFDTRRWSLPSGDTDGAKYGAHAWVLDGRYGYAFGGYGFHMYKDNMLVVDTFTDSIVERRLTPTPHPRNASAMAVADGKLYLFGGHGNESGRQEFETRYYYDLYEYDLRTLSGEKLWEMDSLSYDFLCSQTMIYEPSTRSFVVGTTRYGGQLVRIWRDRPGIEPVTEPLGIPMSIRDIVLQLYYSYVDSSYYFVIDRWLSDMSHELGVYAVTAPLEGVPDRRAEAVNTHQQNPGRLLWWLLGGGVILLVGGGAAIIIWRRRRSKCDVSQELTAKSELPSVAEVNASPHPVSGPNSGLPAAATEVSDGSADSISLVGTFAVKANDGSDITAKFSAKTRDLLAFLILRARNSEKGVAVRNIDETLWKEMEPEAARNNRNVYMRRLRKMLQEVGDISIVSDEKYYVVNLNSIGVDINRILDSFDCLNGNSSRLSASEKWNMMRGSLMKGPLLADVHAAWLDPFKAEYSQQCMHLLNSLIGDTAFRELPEDVQLEIADTIFLHDELNEDALRIKCQILSGRRHVPAMARSVYDNFCKSYFRYMGEDFSVTFHDICR